MSKIKKKYNLTTYPKLGLNYWGVPKCGNTSVKFVLLQASGVDTQSQGHAWVHQPDVNQYITPEQALINSYINFATIRHPYNRVKSLYKDFAHTRPEIGIKKGVDKTHLTNIDYFVDQCIVDTTDNDNVHVRSISYFLFDENNKALVDNIFDIETQHQNLEKFLNVDIVKMNANHSNDIELSDANKEKIYKRYQCDFDNFGYKL